MESENLNDISKQILLSIHTYILLKLKKYETAKTICNNQFKIGFFPYQFIKAKVNYYNVYFYLVK